MMLQDALLVGIDTETTGLDPEQRSVWDLGISVWSVAQRREVAVFTKLFGLEPGDRFDPGVEKLLRVDSSKLEGLPPLSACLAEVNSFLGQFGPFVPVMYNARFDTEMLRSAFRRGGSFVLPFDPRGVVDPLVLVRSVRRYGNSLSEVASWLGFDVSEFAAHTALADARMALRVLLGLMPQLGLSVRTPVEEILARQAVAAEAWELARREREEARRRRSGGAS